MFEAKDPNRFVDKKGFEAVTDEADAHEEELLPGEDGQDDQDAHRAMGVGADEAPAETFKFPGAKSGFGRRWRRKELLTLKNIARIYPELRDIVEEDVAMDIQAWRPFSRHSQLRTPGITGLRQSIPA